MLLTLALILAACNSSDGDNDKDKDDDKVSSEPKILVFGRGGDSVSLDPAIVTDGESFKDILLVL